jgi:hypothetical protein
MNITMIALCILAGLLSVSSLTIQTNARESSGEAELRKSMAERMKANIEGDTETIERLMTNDYVQTDVLGHVQNKSEWLNEYFRPLAVLIKTGKFRWEIYRENDVQVRDLGDTAVVVGSLTLKPRGAIPVPGRGWVESSHDVPARSLRFTRVFVKRNGVWLLAAVHNAWLPEETTRR